ncbi:MAG: TadE/TadG family type IV pilus assembly protein [Candidatus Sericytochromatia bacterium]
MAPATRRAGQALVELALFLPLLLLFLGTLIELGGLYEQSTLAAGAAREGARVAATGGLDAEVTQAVGAYAASMASAHVTVAPAVRASGQDVTVTVDVPVPLTVPGISAILGPLLTVRGQAVMRVE